MHQNRTTVLWVRLEIKALILCLDSKYERYLRRRKKSFSRGKYEQCRSLVEASQIFHRASGKNVGSYVWNSREEVLHMIIILIQNFSALGNKFANLKCFLNVGGCDLCSVSLAQFCIYTHPYGLYKKSVNPAITSHDSMYDINNKKKALKYYRKKWFSLTHSASNIINIVVQVSAAGNICVDRMFFYFLNSAKYFCPFIWICLNY